MNPLRVTARIGGSICMPERPIAIDGLLAAAVCIRSGVAPALTREELVDVEIPVMRSECGRYHLASFAEFEPEIHALRYLNKRPPIEQYQTIGSLAIKRVDIGSGVNKSYRIPLETMQLVEDALTWWCIGDALEVTALLSLIHHLGKKRSVGLGRVVSWAVEPAEAWDGFPVMRSGMPLRTLPTETAGLDATCERAYAVLSYPYWRHEKEELCAVPLSQH